MNLGRPTMNLLALGLVGLLMSSAISADEPPPTGVPIQLNSNGAWCWFQDERAILDGDQLLIQSVMNDGTTRVTNFDLRTGEIQTITLNKGIYRANDHNVGALMVRPDGRYLAVYAGHGDDHFSRYRISTRPGDSTQWTEERKVEAHGRVTYSNVYRMDSGITYNFYRDGGADLDPNYMISHDEGSTWEYGGRLVRMGGVPYTRYTSDGQRIHFTITENHPRQYANSVYHGFVESGNIYQSDGALVGPLSTSTEVDISVTDLMQVFPGDHENVAWTSDIELDEHGHPYIGFSVTKDKQHRGAGGYDHRYHYARWDGNEWHQYEIAYAGSRLYPGEDAYTGLIALHPHDPDVVYISVDVNPETGEPLEVDGERRYEIFRGRTEDRGETWSWTPVTQNSEEDNLRPIVVADEERTVLLWLCGAYNTYTDFDQRVYAMVEP